MRLLHDRDVAEFTDWMRGAGLTVHPPVPTLVHCHVIAGVMSADVDH